MRNIIALFYLPKGSIKQHHIRRSLLRLIVFTNSDNYMIIENPFSANLYSLYEVISVQCVNMNKNIESFFCSRFHFISTIYYLHFSDAARVDKLNNEPKRKDYTLICKTE
jgi:hypothetical protein